MQLFEKADYTIFARYAYPGETVYNYLEDSTYVTDENKNIVLSGTMDEQWTITMERLMETYSYADGDEILLEDFGYRIPQSEYAWVEVRPRAGVGAPRVFAYRTDPEEQVQVTTSWGEVLTANRPGIPHGKGDWIVFAENEFGQPDEGDCWIVNGEVFDLTYRPAG